MYYTKADAEKATILFFEGAGCAERGDVENCRIRTAFTNNEGKQVYLELWGVEVNERTPARHKQYKNVGLVDYCIYRENGEEEQHYDFDVESRSFEYSKSGILNFVNVYLDCNFTDIKILDEFDGYRVHKDGGGYNFIEEFEYKPEIAAARRAKFNEFDMQIREQLCEKYAQCHLLSMDDESITVRIYASDKKMQAHEMDPNKRIIRIEI